MEGMKNMKMCKQANMKTWKYGNVKVVATLVVSIFAYFHTSTFAYSAEVTSAEAREAVAGWATLGDALTGGARFAASGVKDVATYLGADGVGWFHVVSFEGGGFVVTSGDTEIAPILAYSEDGEFVASEENPLWCMLTQDVAGRTKHLEDEDVSAAKNAKNTKSVLRATVGGAASSANASAWARLKAAADKPVARGGYSSQSSVADLRVGPLCATRWYQEGERGDYCYNYYTPFHFACGCVATAFAQVMRYFEWPKAKVAVGDHWYNKFVVTDSLGYGNVNWYFGTDPDSGEVHTLFGNTYGDSGDALFPEGPDFGGPYDWANMPANPSSDGVNDAQRKAIGQLCRDCGISVHTRYRSGASSASGTRIKLRLVDQFGYANAEVARCSPDSSYDPYEDYVNAMLGSFDIGSPCTLGVESSGGGHAIVGDGYGYSDGRLYIHYNFGWGNHSANAWYTPADEGKSSLSVIKHVVYNIWTPEKCAESNLTVVSGRVLSGAGEPITGQAVIATDKKTGATFNATTGDNGIYAFLLPPETAYVVSTALDGLSARATCYAARCKSNAIYEDRDAIGKSYNVGNVSRLDLRLAAQVDEEKWVGESSATKQQTGGWSEDVAYGADGKAYLYGEVAFTPYNASTGNVVTVEAKAQFFEHAKEYAPDAGVQAAVRLGTNGCFQVWTRLRQGYGGQAGNGEQGTGNGWIDVEADGVTPVSGEEYTLRVTFDYNAGTYSVEVNDAGDWTAFKLSTLNSQLSTPSSFPLAAQASRVSSVAFMGETYFTSMNGDCRYEISGFAADEALVLSNNVEVVLNAAKAAWLNSCSGGRDAIVASAATLSRDDFDTAYLLNLDIADSGRSYTFEVTDIDVGEASVSVAVRLTRPGKLEQKINGTLKFYGAATLEEFKTAAAPLGTVTLSDEGGDFSDGDTTTATFPKNGNTFFNAKIEEK